MDLVLSTFDIDAFIAFPSFQKKYLNANSRKSHLLARSDNVLHTVQLNSVIAIMKNYYIHL